MKKLSSFLFVLFAQVCILASADAQLATPTPTPKSVPSPTPTLSVEEKRNIVAFAQSAAPFVASDSVRILTAERRSDEDKRTDTPLASWPGITVPTDIAVGGAVSMAEVLNDRDFLESKGVVLVRPVPPFTQGFDLNGVYVYAPETRDVTEEAAYSLGGDSKTVFGNRLQITDGTVYLLFVADIPTLPDQSMDLRFYSIIKNLKDQNLFKSSNYVRLASRYAAYKIALQGAPLPSVGADLMVEAFRNFQPTKAPADTRVVLPAAISAEIQKIRLNKAQMLKKDCNSFSLNFQMTPYGQALLREVCYYVNSH